MKERPSGRSFYFFDAVRVQLFMSCPEKNCGTWFSHLAPFLLIKVADHTTHGVFSSIEPTAENVEFGVGAKAYQEIDAISTDRIYEVFRRGAHYRPVFEGLESEIIHVRFAAEVIE